MQVHAQKADAKVEVLTLGTQTDADHLFHVPSAAKLKRTPSSRLPPIAALIRDRTSAVSC
jgi:hypothetical protein